MAYLVNLNLLKSLLNINDVISILSLHFNISTEISYSKEKFLLNPTKHYGCIKQFSSVNIYWKYWFWVTWKAALPIPYLPSNSKILSKSLFYWLEIMTVILHFQSEKGNLNISENLRENCILQRLCVPFRFL